MPTKGIKISRIVLTLFMQVVCMHTFSQEWNSARLSVLSGGSIPFNFNSLDKIKNGIEIANGLTLGISMTDNNEPGHDLEGFVLQFRAFNYQTNIQGDAHTIPLNRIRVKADNFKGLGSGHSYGYTNLTADWLPLFSYSNIVWQNLNWADNQLNVSFECGKPVSSGGNGSLMGESPDYYQVEIEFELIPTGPGF